MKITNEKGPSHTSDPSSRNFLIRLDEICNEKRPVNGDVLRSVAELAIDIAREGREGRRIGTMFIVGDSETVLNSSWALILDPLQGHAPERKRVDDSNLRETVKELAQLDGAFIVSNEGIVLSAARYIDASSKNIELPLGLGSRHVAAASITRDTKAVAVVVSESGVVRILEDGKLIAEIMPELWFIQRFTSGYANKDVKTASGDKNA